MADEYRKAANAGAGAQAVRRGVLGWATRFLWVAHVASIWAMLGIPAYLTIGAGYGLLVHGQIQFVLFVVSPVLAVASLLLVALGRIDLEEGIFGASSGMFLLLVNAGLLWVVGTS